MQASISVLGARGISCIEMELARWLESFPRPLAITNTQRKNQFEASHSVTGAQQEQEQRWWSDPSAVTKPNPQTA